MTRAMVDRSGLPVGADIDTGFGNAINVLYTSRHRAVASRAGVSVGRRRHLDGRTRSSLLRQGHPA